MEMTHDQFAYEVDRMVAAARRVGIWPVGLVITDAARPRWWKRRTIDHGRLVVYVKRASREPAAIVADICRAIIRNGTAHLTPGDKVARAAALRRIAAQDPTC